MTCPLLILLPCDCKTRFFHLGWFGVWFVRVFFLTERNSISALSNKFCRGGGYDTYGDDLTKDVCFINEGYLDLCRRQGRRVWVQKYI